jgi:hypothetical protein
LLRVHEFVALNFAVSLKSVQLLFNNKVINCLLNLLCIHARLTLACARATMRALKTDFHLLDPKLSPLDLGVDPAAGCTLCLSRIVVAAAAAATLQKA